MLKTIKLLLTLLNKKQKYIFWFIVVLSIIAAIAEMASILLIIPLVSLILQVGENVEFNDRVLPFIDFLGENPNGQTLILITALFALLAIFIKSLNVVLMQRFVLGLEARLSIDLLEKILKKSYIEVTEKGSAHYTKVLTTEIGQLIYNGYFPLLNLLTNLSVVCLIAFLLLATNWQLAFFLIVIFYFCYATIYSVMKNRLDKIGLLRVNANKMRFKVITDLFSSLKYVFTDNKQLNFLKLFSVHAEQFAKYQAQSQIIGILPRYVVEFFLFVILFAYLSWSVMFSNAVISDDLPVLVMYIYAAYRLMPAAQMTFASASQLTFGQSIVRLVQSELKQDNHTEIPHGEITQFNESIMFHNVGHSIQEKTILKNVSCEIFQGEIVGIVGKSGAGKSTFIDIISGISQHTEGIVSVDGQNIQPGIALFEPKLISYVPQQTLLLDASLKKNIEFFRTSDDKKFEKVIKYANLNDVVSDSDNEDNREVGERGANLSGGQAQRIGIARAFFKNSDILLLDEATSALDSINEQMIISHIFKMAPEKTILVATHNIELIKKCNKILFFKNGSIEQIGSYLELLDSNKNFRNLTKENNQ